MSPITSDSSISRDRSVFNPNKGAIQPLAKKKIDEIRHTDSLNVPPMIPIDLSAPLPFTKDTMESCSALQAMAVQQQAQVQPESMATDDNASAPVSSTPTIKAPKEATQTKSERIREQLAQAIARNLVLQRDKLEGEGHGNDKAIHEALVEVIKELLKVKDQQLLTGKDIIMFEQQKLHELEKKFRLLTKEIIKGENDLDIAAKVKLAADITLGVMTAAAVTLFILSFFTFGATIAAEAAVGAIAGVAAITSGAAEIFIAETKFKVEGFQAEMLELREKRELSMDTVNHTFKSENALNDHVLRTMKEVHIIEKNRNDSIKGMAAAAA